MSVLQPVRRAGGRDIFRYGQNQQEIDYIAQQAEEADSECDVLAYKDTRQRNVVFRTQKGETMRFKEITPRTLLSNMLVEDGSLEVEALHRNIRSMLRSSLINDPILTGIQRVGIPYILLGNYDVTLESRSGGGKTLAYAAPIIYKIIKYKQMVRRSSHGAMYCLIVTSSSKLCNQLAAVFDTLVRGTNVSVVRSHYKLQVSEVLHKLSDCNIFICDIQRVQFHFLDSNDPDELPTNNKLSCDYLKYVVFDESDYLIGNASGGSNSNYVNKPTINPRIIMATSEYRDLYYSYAPTRPFGHLHVSVGIDDDREFEFIFEELDNEKKRARVAFKNIFMKICKKCEMRNGKWMNPKKTVIFVNSPGLALELCGVIKQIADKEEVQSITVIDTVPQLHSVIGKMMKNELNILITMDDKINCGLNFPNIDIVVNAELTHEDSPHRDGIFAKRIQTCGRKNKVGTVYTIYHKGTDDVAALDIGKNAYKHQLPSYIVKLCEKTVGFEYKKRRVIKRQSQIQRYLGIDMPDPNSDSDITDYLDSD
ncbi:RNA helicase [Aphelenchoides besseyi]|nr:RNA helicase [Aphelenchoides besseyi]